jgi:hypothetical protein
MHIEQFEKSHVRKILMGMIVDATVLSRLASRWDGSLFREDWANLIAGWCIGFYQKYNKAPENHIEGLFHQWADDNPDTAGIELIGKFLGQLSNEYAQLKKTINASYILDVAAEHFNKVRVEKLIEGMQGELDGGKLDKAFALASKFNRLDISTKAQVDLLEDPDVIRGAFSERNDSLVEYKGALGNFFGSAFERDSFIAFMGPEKRGKTWWLIDVAWRAMLQGRRVAFFEVGDMSQKQIVRRFMVRASGRPLKPKVIQVPTAIEHPDSENQIPHIDFEERVFKRKLNAKDAWKACLKTIRKQNSEHALLKLWCYPNSTLSMSALGSELQILERQGWSPDLIVIDYADILAPPPGYTESRDQINANWKAMRALSQSLHCCLVTATQSNAASYYADTVDRSNFSDDKRKFAHVTGMIGINQSPTEKEKGVMRLNWLVLRESEFDETKCCYVAGCLALANPAMRSTF